MSVRKTVAFALMLCLSGVAFSVPVSSQTVAESQIKALLPDEADLPSFLHVSPAGENLLPNRSYSQSMPVQEQFWLPNAKPQASSAPQEVNVHPDHFLAGLRRVLYSSDGQYFVEMRIELCATPQAAQQELQKFLLDSSGVFKPGTFSGASSIGDEALFLPADFHGSSLVFWAGNAFVFISGHQSVSSSRLGGHLIFPPSAVEAVAYQTLLKASQHPELTGISVQQAQMNVNGHTLPKNALQVAGQTYLPVAEFAKAMGLTTQWNAKTGALTLSGAGRKTVMLTADSTAASVGTAKAALTVPVLKQAGQPVMTLDDLLAVTGGHITAHSGNDVQVKG